MLPSSSYPNSIENWTPKLGNETHIESELKKAFSAWSRHSGLRFVRAEPDGARGDISVAFGRYAHGDNYPFDGPGKWLEVERGPSNNDVHTGRRGTLGSTQDA